MTYDFDLGPLTRHITTDSPEAQTWFDRGLNWLYGFNQEEAVACFRHAAEADPACAMAWWGVAYAAGPFYNMPWPWFSPDEAIQATAVCHDAAHLAAARAPGASPVEQALIQALLLRFQKPEPVPPEEFAGWDDAFAAAMREIYAAFPDDADIAAIFVEAMMTRTPWKLWDTRTSEPLPGSDTLECKQVLEAALARHPDHPALLHLYIHVMEMSLEPETALPAADRLRAVAAEAGHLQHMPAHIYTLSGMYDRAVTVSRRAIAADRKYLAHAGADNFYTTARCHDLHMMMYAAMMSGRYAPALEAAEEMQATLTPELLGVKRPHMAVTLEGYFSTKLHVLVRFGRWRAIIAEPLPEDRRLYCVTTAMHRYARTVAHAALGEIAAAEAERAAFYAAWEAIPPTRLFFNNLATDILAVGAAMLEGELAYRKGDFDLAFEHLREAARRDDALYYTEPWAWMHPPRHALGALLLEQGRVAEAEAVYRADLGYDDTLCRCSRHPENVWALHGFVECAERLGKTAEAAFARQRLTLATARADFPIEASCCCRGG